MEGPFNGQQTLAVGILGFGPNGFIAGEEAHVTDFGARGPNPISVPSLENEGHPEKYSVGGCFK